MATQTTGNLKLSKPDGTDKVKEFRAPYNSNLDKIDEAVSAQSQQIDDLSDEKAPLLKKFTFNVTASSSAQTLSPAESTTGLDTNWWCVESTLGTPSSQLLDWTWTTGTNALTLTVPANGCASAGTTVTLLLAKLATS